MLRPRHIVLATGVIGGKPLVPDLPGLSSFAGSVIHSSAFTKAADYDAKRAIVVGAATSGHDIALDLHDHGVDVTMVQRNPIVVVQVATAGMAYGAYTDPGIPTELVDIRYGIGMIKPLREIGARAYHRQVKEIDGELLAKLEKVGFRLGDGYDGMGHHDLFLRTAGVSTSTRAPRT